MENLTETQIYSTALITGVKQTLLKVLTGMKKKPSWMQTLLFLELKNLIIEVNQFPTVAEIGYFEWIPATEEIDFIKHNPTF
jgi:hypothetical protein